MQIQLPLDDSRPDPAWSRPERSGWPLLSAGFRPFFLAAGLQAALMVPLWLALLQGEVTAPLPYAPVLWHGHEMVFGFGMAAVAGFLLTAVPNWTNCEAPRGGRLAALALLWLAARLAALADGAHPAVAAALSLAFLPALALVVAPPLIKAGKPRNLAFLGLLALLTLADGLVQTEMLGGAATGRQGLWLGIFILLLMIGMVGGRVIPGFTQNGLRGQGIAFQPKARPRLDKLALLTLAAGGLAESIDPAGRLGGALCLAAGLLHLLRLSGWGGWQARRIPLLWVLHLGYLWLAAGLLLLGLSSLIPALPPEAALHALTAGAIGMMVLGIMSRAALGHSGRPLVAARPVVAAYLLVCAAAVVRVAGVLVAPLPALHLAGVLWSLAFLLFLAVYAPICLTPRPGAK